MSRCRVTAWFLLKAVLSVCGAGCSSRSPDPAPREMPSASSASVPDTPPSPADGRFVVIHGEHLTGPATEWAQYRRSQGWDVKVSSVRQAVEAVSSADDLIVAGWSYEQLAAMHARQLRTFLHREYKAAAAEGYAGERFSVLLLGDVPDLTGAAPPGHEVWNDIPTFYHVQTDPALMDPRGRPDICTDADYQFVDGDASPDFALGRVPARSAAAARTVLEKIQRYELHPPPGPWRRRITYIAGEGRFGAIDRLLEVLFTSMVESIVSYDYDVHVTYANPDSPYCAPPSEFNRIVRHRIEEGALLVNYIGHGMPTRLDSLRWLDRKYPICDISEARSLAILEGRLPLMFIIACSTGQFDLSAGQDSLAETLLLNPAGPVAIISGSRMTHPYANALLQKNLTQQVCQERRETVGGVDLYGERGLIKLDDMDAQLEMLGTAISLQMNWATPPDSLRTMHVLLYNLLGDPATRLPHPSLEIDGLSFVNGKVSGRVHGAGHGHAMITAETPRTRFPRRREMRFVDGESDPGFESKAAINYELANDRILARASVPVQADGAFEATLVIPDAELARGDLRLKVYVTSAQGDAVASAPLASDARESTGP